MDVLKALPPLEYVFAPVYVVLILAEACAVRRGLVRGRYEQKDAWTSITMGLGSAVAAVLSGLTGFGLLFLAYEHRLFDIPVTVLSGLACFVLDDLRFYWSHRLQHRSRWFWAVHVVHHSSQHYNLSTAVRQPWTGSISGLIVLNLPLVLLGFHPALIAFCNGLNLFYQFFLHTESVGRLHPWIEAVMNTPSHHRVHHAVNAPYLDANYAGTLIIWDRVFGTFVPERDGLKPVYGLVKNIETYNPFWVAFGEYAAIAHDLLRPGPSAVQRFFYLFAPPGYSHDGTRESTESLKAAYVRAHPEEAGKPGLPASF